MNLKEAREIARKVGATIEEKKPEFGPVSSVKFNPTDNPKPALETEYIIRLGVIRIGPNGTRENIVIHARNPHEAADLAVIETGRAARALVEVCKAVYTDSDLIFGAPRS